MRHDEETHLVSSPLDDLCIDIWNPFDRETGWCSNLLTRTYLPGVVLIARAGSSRYRVCTHLPTLSLNIRDVKTFQHVKIIKL